MNMDKEAFAEATKILRDNSLTPGVVKSDDEARRLTESDPCGYKWKCGEKYFVIKDLGGLWL